MARLSFDYCPNCGEPFTVETDGEGSVWSLRDELPCECRREVFCQRCDCHKCADCGKPLCCACGGQDLSGEHFCSAHVPKPDVRRAQEEYGAFDIALTPAQVFSLAEATHVAV